MNPSAARLTPSPSSKRRTTASRRVERSLAAGPKVCSIHGRREELMKASYAPSPRKVAKAITKSGRIEITLSNARAEAC